MLKHKQFCANRGVEGEVIVADSSTPLYKIGASGCATKIRIGSIYQQDSLVILSGPHIYRYGEVKSNPRMPGE